jgi:SAM-dependent methyltransferase
MRLLQHLDLLKRTRRSSLVKEVIARVVRPGMRVLDAGCGVGLLSVWAAQAGAREVVAVDLIDLEVARRVVADNGVADRVSLVRADLRELPVAGSFDVVLAFIYMNDVRRDEASAELACAINRKVLSATGVSIPDRVRYTARLFQWPRQDCGARWQEFDASIRQLELVYDLKLGGFGEVLRNSPDPRLFPARRPETGELERDDAMALSDAVVPFELDVRAGSVSYPATVELTATARGTAHAVVWSQDLMFENQVLFRNESVSWLYPAVALEPNQRLRLRLDEQWRKTNVHSTTGAVSA